MFLTAEQCGALRREAFNARRLSAQIETKWSVVTGPPYSGKTALVSALAHQGILTVHDCARTAITEGQASGKTRDEVRCDYDRLQDRISDLMVAEADRLDPEQPVLWDYSFPDNLAYQAAAGRPWHRHHVARATKYRFQRAYLLEPVGDYDPDVDPVRAEPLSERTQLLDTIKAIYELLGIEVVRVPNAPLNDRLRYFSNYES